MLYDYECKNCGEQLIDVNQRHDDDPLVQCPACDTPSLSRIVTGGLYASVKKVNTIGSLADHNSKKYKSQIQEAEHQKKESMPEPEKPWYHKHGNKSLKDIGKMSDTQKTKYIMDGDS